MPYVYRFCFSSFPITSYRSIFQLWEQFPFYDPSLFSLVLHESELLLLFWNMISFYHTEHLFMIVRTWPWVQCEFYFVCFLLLEWKLYVLYFVKFVSCHGIVSYIHLCAVLRYLDVRLHTIHSIRVYIFVYISNDSHYLYLYEWTCIELAQVSSNQLNNFYEQACSLFECMDTFYDIPIARSCFLSSPMVYQILCIF